MLRTLSIRAKWLQGKIAAERIPRVWRFMYDRAKRLQPFCPTTDHQPRLLSNSNHYKYCCNSLPIHTVHSRFNPLRVFSLSSPLFLQFHISRSPLSSRSSSPALLHTCLSVHFLVFFTFFSLPLAHHLLHLPVNSSLSPSYFLALPHFCLSLSLSFFHFFVNLFPVLR